MIKSQRAAKQSKTHLRVKRGLSSVLTFHQDLGKCSSSGSKEVTIVKSLDASWLDRRYSSSSFSLAPRPSHKTSSGSSDLEARIWGVHSVRWRIGDGNVFCLPGNTFIIILLRTSRPLMRSRFTGIYTQVVEQDEHFACLPPTMQTTCPN